MKVSIADKIAIQIAEAHETDSDSARNKLLEVIAIMMLKLNMKKLKRMR